MLVLFDLTKPPHKVTPCGLIWEQDNCQLPQLDHAECVCPWPILPHYHQYMVECYRVTSGQGTIGVGNRVYLAGNTLPTVQINPGVVHWAIPSGDQPMVLSVYNAPAFNSFEVPDFVPVLADDPEHGFELAVWQRELANELTYRQHRGGSDGSPPGDPKQLADSMSTGELVEALCLPDYRQQFATVKHLFAA